MDNGSYYLDTCIWLNLFKKEGDASKGNPYWKIAEDFIRRVIKSKQDNIFYSGIVLRELQLKLNPEEYKKARYLIEKIYKFSKVDILQEDKNFVRRLESRYDFEISFYDLLHLAVSKRLDLMLITRDKQLIEIAKENGVDARTP
ncbi:MAG: PIN domain-containing protein [Nanoarchaeota archaeon]|nr:PIN domain-containing protein [Nanoarchaeota archaeon]